MTITLFWWYLPVAFYIAGWIAFARTNGWNILHPTIGFLCWVLALGICIGHWI